MKETSYSGTVTQYSYDECDRLERITVISTGTEGISAGTSVTTYKRDEYGRITDFTDESGTITYTYDELGRVESVTDAEGITLAYTYDTYGRKASVKAVKLHRMDWGMTLLMLERIIQLVTNGGKNV